MHRHNHNHHHHTNITLWLSLANDRIGTRLVFFSFYIQMEFQMLSRLFINQHYHLMTLHKALFFEYLLVSWFHNMFLLRLQNIRLLPMWKIFSDLTCDPIIMKRLRVIPYSILTSSFSWQKCIRRRKAAECVWAQFDFCLPLLSAEKWTIRLRKEVKSAIDNHSRDFVELQYFQICKKLRSCV